jgi:hypothetical protein
LRLVIARGTWLQPGRQGHLHCCPKETTNSWLGVHEGEGSEEEREKGTGGSRRGGGGGGGGGEKVGKGPGIGEVRGEREGRGVEAWTRANVLLIVTYFITTLIL